MPKHIIASIVISLLSLSLFTSSVTANNTASGSKPQTSLPIQVSADSLNSEQQSGTSIYKGRVKITQGKMTLRGDKVEIKHPNNQFKRLIANGTPATFKRFDEIKQVWVTGHAQNIDYNVEQGKLVLIGDAQVEQAGEQRIEGPELFYDINTGILQAQGSQTNPGRVSVTLTPSPKDQNKNATQGQQ